VPTSVSSRIVADIEYVLTRALEIGTVTTPK